MQKTRFWSVVKFTKWKNTFLTHSSSLQHEKKLFKAFFKFTKTYYFQRWSQRSQCHVHVVSWAFFTKQKQKKSNNEYELFLKVGKIFKGGYLRKRFFQKGIFLTFIKKRVFPIVYHVFQKKKNRMTFFGTRTCVLIFSLSKPFSRCNRPLVWGKLTEIK